MLQIPIQTRGYPRYDSHRPPPGGPFSLQLSVFSPLEGTKPCFSFGKCTLGPHGPPMGRHWWSKSFGNSTYFHTCASPECYKSPYKREVTRGNLGTAPPLVVHLPYKSQYSRPWGHKTMLFLLENVHLGHLAPPWGDSGGPNPSVISTVFIHAWYKTILFIWKTHTWATWPPGGRHWWSKLWYKSPYKRRLP